MANAVLLNPKPAARKRRRRVNPIVAKPVRRRRRRNPRRMTDRGKRAVTVIGGAAGGLAHEFMPDFPFVDEDLLVLAGAALLAFTAKGIIADGATGAAAYAAGAMAKRIAGGDGAWNPFSSDDTEGLYKTGYLASVPTARLPRNAGRSNRIAQMTHEATAGLYEDEY